MSDHEEDVLPPQFVLILQDNPETGELDIGGVQRPEAFDETSPSHVVGAFIRDNLELIVQQAKYERVHPVMPASQSGLILPPHAKV